MRVGVAGIAAFLSTFLACPPSAHAEAITTVGGYVSGGVPTAAAGVTATTAGGGADSANRCAYERLLLPPGERVYDADGAAYETDGAGEWYVRSCLGPDGRRNSYGVVFVPDAVDPLTLAQQALRQLHQTRAMTRIDRAELLTTADAARILGIDREQVYRLIHTGVLPARKEGGVFVLRRKDVKETAHQVGAPPGKGEGKPWGPARGRRTIRLQPPEFVAMTPDQEQHAIDVLADVVANHLLKGRVP